MRVRSKRDKKKGISAVEAISEAQSLFKNPSLTDKEERSEGRGGNIRVLLVCGLALQLYIEM